MAQSAVVIGGAGKVGTGVAQAFRDAQTRVVVVDPEGGDLAGFATPTLADRVGPVQVAVVSLPARGLGRDAGEFRPAGLASEALPARFAALELAMAALADGGTLIELAGAAALDPGSDEAGWIARWQGQVRSGLDRTRGIHAILCAITCYVPPEQAIEVGRTLVDLAQAGRGGICRIDAVDGRAEWVD